MGASHSALTYMSCLLYAARAVLLKQSVTRLHHQDETYVLGVPAAYRKQKVTGCLC